MSEALGDQIFVDPIECDGGECIGRVVSIGAKAQKFGNFLICDTVKYSETKIKKRVKYERNRVDVVFFEDLVIIRRM